MISTRCERARHWVSLELDGALSGFEAAVLDRHLRSCDDCRVFAADVGAQTRLLRAAPLDELVRPVELPSRARRMPAARIGALTAAAAAAVAAITLGSPGGATPRGAATEASRGVQTGPMFVVVAAEPGPASGLQDLTVPRLKTQSPTIDDGPVHGYLNTPV